MNIAAFELEVVEEDAVILAMRVVVGRLYSRTPVLSDTMRYIVLNPYWHVPRGIEITPGMSTSTTLNLFTSMFLHGGFFHLAGNMLYLWIFGDNVEDRLGHMRFLLFYLISGLAAALLFIWTEPHLQIPLVGASGAIAGVLGAYLLSYPRARIATLIFFGFFIRVIYIPAVIVLGLWFVMQVLSGLPSAGAGGNTGGVAFFAHVGGFIAGLLLVIPFSPRGNRGLGRWR